jgi:hypothetical protein
MGDNPLADRLRSLARHCREQAALAMGQRARKALLALADTYEQKAELLEREQSGDKPS